MHTSFDRLIGLSMVMILNLIRITATPDYYLIGLAVGALLRIDGKVGVLLVYVE